MTRPNCPFCGNLVFVGDHPKLGERVTCQECGMQLEVVHLDPVGLDWPSSYDDNSNFDEELQ